MAPSRRGGLCALAALGALTVWLPQSQRCAVLDAEVLSHLDAEVEGGGAVRTARKVKALGTMMKFLQQNSGHRLHGAEFDTNAIGESWVRSAMGHWVDRAGAPSTAERLEGELMALKIGRRSDSQRQAMRMKRMVRQRELQSRVPKPVNAMLHWTDRPVGMSAEQLEEELMATKIGGRMGNEASRRAMHLKRMARQEDLYKSRRAQLQLRVQAKPSTPLVQKEREERRHQPGSMLFASHYDTNAVGETFRAGGPGEQLAESAELLERQLAAIKVGRKSADEGQRGEMRLRRAQNAKAQ